MRVAVCRNDDGFDVYADVSWIFAANVLSLQEVGSASAAAGFYEEAKPPNRCCWVSSAKGPMRQSVYK